jgi:DNA-binding transcriptional ArsR family regulator
VVSDPLTTTLSALADPTRRAVLAQLASGDRSVTELAAPFAMSKVLERAHLIERSRDAQWRPCKLAPGPLKEVASWLNQYRQHWEDRLDVYLNDIQEKETGHDR